MGETGPGPAHSLAGITRRAAPAAAATADLVPWRTPKPQRHETCPRRETCIPNALGSSLRVVTAVASCEPEVADGPGESRRARGSWCRCAGSGVKLAYRFR